MVLKMFEQLKLRLPDAVLSYDGVAAKVAFTFRGFLCEAILGDTNAKVKFILGKGHSVTGHVPCVRRELDMAIFMRKLEELRRDAEAKRGMLERFAAA